MYICLRVTAYRDVAKQLMSTIEKETRRKQTYTSVIEYGRWVRLRRITKT